MSGGTEKLKSDFIPPPTGGLNLISDPMSFAPNEAKALDNYYIYEWGIRECGPRTVIAMPDGSFPTSFLPFTAAAISRSVLIGTSSGKTYIYDGSSVSLVSGVRGFWNACAYNGVVFLPDSAGAAVATYTFGGVYAATSFTVGGATGAVVFKNRMYFWGITFSVYYAATVGAITGPTNTFDFSSVFQSGSKPVFIASWPYNQGLTNDELFVIGSDSGEILIYSGDFPAAANWQLVCRLEIPRPLCVGGGLSPLANVIKLGQDILVNTCRGVISLAKVLAGRAELSGTDFYSVSRKLGPVMTGCLGDKSTVYPFAYFAGGAHLYVMNYELGAWSRFPSFTTGTDYIPCIGVSTGVSSTPAIPSSYVLVSLTSGGMIRIDESALLGSSALTYEWDTPYMNHGTGNQKLVKYVRVISRDMASSVIHNGIGISNDFDDSKFGTVDNASVAAQGQQYTVQELRPAGAGRWISYRFSKTGSNTACNEIGGAEVAIETGGGY